MLPYLTGTVRKINHKIDRDTPFQITVSTGTSRQLWLVPLLSLNIGYDTEDIIRTRFQLTGINISVLIDSGSSVCTCSLLLAESINAHVIQLDKPIGLFGFDRQIEKDLFLSCNFFIRHLRPLDSVHQFSGWRNPIYKGL